MRNLYTAFFVSALLNLACSKNESGTPNPAEVKIASISNVGEFKYDGDRLKSVGNEMFFYNSSGRISGSRIHQKDTTSWRIQPIGQPQSSTVRETVERSTYVWENNRVKERLIDTLLLKYYSLDQPATDPLSTISLLTNFLADKYYASGSQLDSLSYESSAFTNGIRKINYVYDSRGNIVKMVETVSNHTGMVPGYNTYRIETEIEYDDKPNPFYYLYKKTGLVLNKVKAFNFSVNNPTKLKVTTKQFGQSITVTKNLQYEYNSAGFPVKIGAENQSSMIQPVTITYH